MKSRAELPHLKYPVMNQTRILNPHAFSVGSPAPPFGGASRDFDGITDKVAIPSGIWSGLSAVTVAAWFKLDTAQSNRNIIGGWATGGLQILTRLQSSGALQCYIYASGAVGGNVNLTAGTGTWTHMAMTYNGSTMVGYLDGVAGSTTYSPSGAVNTPTTPVPAIGYGGSGSAYAIDGLIADARTYDRALSAGEIADLASGTHVASGLIGWWILDDDDVLDYSGEGNDGVDTGTTFSTDGPLD
jgi:hypothetical protein